MAALMHLADAAKTKPDRATRLGMPQGLCNVPHLLSADCIAYKGPRRLSISEFVVNTGIPRIRFRQT